MEQEVRAMSRCRQVSRSRAVPANPPRGASDRTPNKRAWSRANERASLSASQLPLATKLAKTGNNASINRAKAGTGELKTEVAGWTSVRGGGGGDGHGGMAVERIRWCCAAAAAATSTDVDVALCLGGNACPVGTVSSNDGIGGG